MSPDASEELPDSGLKLFKTWIASVVEDLLLKKLPESLDRIQIRRVPRQIDESDLKFCGKCLDHLGVVIAGIVQDVEDLLLIRVLLSERSQHGTGALGIDRFEGPSIYVLIINAKSARDIEVQTSGSGQDLLLQSFLYPSVSEDKVILWMERVPEVDLALKLAVLGDRVLINKEGLSYFLIPPVLIQEQDDSNPIGIAPLPLGPEFRH